MRPSVFWSLTFVLAVIISIAVGNRVPLAVWGIAAAIVLAARWAYSRATRKREAELRAGFERLDAESDIRAHGDAEVLIAASLKASNDACDRASQAIESQMAPSVAVDIATVRNELEKFTRTGDAANDLYRARLIEAHAMSVQARSAHGISRGTARGVGGILGVWRSFND